MSIDIKNFVKNKIKEYDANLDTRDGSGLSDFLINPLSSILESFYNDQKTALSNLSLSEVESIPEDTMDSIAGTYLLERQTGSKSYGEIYLYFSTPREVTIPKNTQFEIEGGTLFETISDYSVSRSQLTANTSEYPYYRLGPLNVFCTEEKEIEVPANTSFNLTSGVTVSPVKISNKTDFTVGSETENNTSLYNRILSNMYGKSLASPLAIKGLLQDNYSTIVSVDVVGAGSPLMLRDLITDTTDLDSFHEENFLFCYYNQHGGLYDKKHMAYYGNFIDEDETEDIQFPTVGTWVDEFSNDLYEGIYKLNAYYAEQNQYVMIKEFFTSEPGEWQDDLSLVLGSEATTNALYTKNPGTGTITTSGTAVSGTGTDFMNEINAGYHIHVNGMEGVVGSVNSAESLTLEEALTGDVTAETNFEYSVIKTTGTGNWLLHDGATTGNLLQSLNEFGLSSGELRLGKTLEAGDIPTATVPVPLHILQQVGTIVADGSNNGQVWNNPEIPLLDPLAQYVNEINNFSPIIHKPLGQHLGIEIDCKMRTSDGTENGEVAYITVLRNQEIYVPHDGYGIAWRKQPEFLLRMEANSYEANATGAAQKAADLERFAYEYDKETPEDYLGIIKANPEYWKYNVFLVDNDALQDEVWVGSDQIWDQTGGKNQFLQATKVWIEPDIDYSFKIKIYQYMGTEAWIWDSNDSQPADAQIERGQTYPAYSPKAGTKIDAGNGRYKLNPEGDHFGIGVGETQNYEWYLNDLYVYSIIETYPMHLFRFKATDLELTDPLYVNYYGLGFDQTDEDPSALVGKVKFGVYKAQATTPVWEEVGTHTEGPVFDNISDIKIAGTLTTPSDYLDDQGYINFAATAANVGTGYSGQVDHTLRSYFIELNNGEVTGSHRGNTTDIYVHDPINIGLGTALVYMTSNTIQTSTVPGIHGYIQEIIEVRDYTSQVAFDPANYIIINKNKALTYSESANYEISFNVGIDVTNAYLEIVYRYWVKGDECNALINSTEYRYPSADYLVKVTPPTIINITSLEYSGAPTEKRVKEVLKNYFNSLTDQYFDKSDIVDILYDEGATYVNLDMGITIMEYDTVATKTTVDFTEQTHTIPSENLSRYYTNLSLLSGVSKI